ncbi:MAG: Tryptophan synthase alpha chain [Labilithrix sp.]|nr:Tryptophan synthase alpha chain [Labilithrix sp.]
MRAWALLLVVTLVALVAVSCSEPHILEDSAAACSNGLDDDEDGRADCADPGCATSGACERDEVSCSNGLDDDLDGLFDCEQASCIEGGFCQTVPADCDVVTRTGCTRGLACEPLAVGGTSFVCTRPGSVDENDRCKTTADDASGGCKAAEICYGLGLCTIPCVTDQQCPRSSACLRVATQPYGVCSLTCLPATGCVSGYGCLPLQRAGFKFANGGWMHSCLADSQLDGGFVAKGEAKVGEPCLDGARGGSPPATVCGSGLLCVPDGDGAICREVCLGEEDGREGRCASGRCVVIDPYDSRAPRPIEPYRVGVCLP